VKNLNNYIILSRPLQYLKNLFIFLPAFFAMRIAETDLILHSLIAFGIFSLIASSVYIFNDLLDIEEDKKHPKKKSRPLASGKVSKKEAYILISIYLIFSFLTAYLFMPSIILYCGIYLILNLAYTIKLKHVTIIDIFIIASGFILRLFTGAAATDVPLSMWIIIVTFLLALFLGFAKRRDDVLIHLETGNKTRKLIDGYNLEFLNLSMSIMSSVIIVAYIMYTVSEDVISKLHSDKLYITVIFVILGIMRYLQISLVEKDSGSPTDILAKDRLIQISIILWIITFGVLIYQ